MERDNDCTIGLNNIWYYDINKLNNKVVSRAIQMIVFDIRHHRQVYTILFIAHVVLSLRQFEPALFVILSHFRQIIIIKKKNILYVKQMIVDTSYFISKVIIKFV